MTWAQHLYYPFTYSKVTLNIFWRTVHYFKVRGRTVLAMPSTVQYSTIKTHTATATLI